MEDSVIFESQVYAKGSKAVLPFKIVVEETFAGGIRQVTVKRVNYLTVEGRTFEEVNVLCGSFWKED